jgi:hypothetical protein
MTMSSDGREESRRGLWLVALVGLGLLAMVVWDQLHVRPGARVTAAPPPRAAGVAAAAPATSPADTVAPSPRAVPEAAGDEGSDGQSGADDSMNGQHAM